MWWRDISSRILVAGNQTGCRMFQQVGYFGSTMHKTYGSGNPEEYERTVGRGKLRNCVHL